MRKEHAGINKVIFSENDICALLGPANALCRGFVMCPGMVFSAFCHEGSVHVFSIQALIRPGKGELHLINIDCAKQQEYCRVAYEHTKLLTNNTLSNVDVILTVLHPLSDSEKNYIGCAACVAILSALHGVVYSDKELFLGGCDLFGNLYLDEKAMDPFVEQLYGKFTTVYNRAANSSDGKPYRGGLATMMSSSRGQEHMPCIQSALLMRGKTVKVARTSTSETTTIPKCGLDIIQPELLASKLYLAPPEIGLGPEIEKIVAYMRFLFSKDDKNDPIADLSDSDKKFCLETFVEKQLTESLRRNILSYYKLSLQMDSEVYTLIQQTQ